MTEESVILDQVFTLEIIKSIKAMGVRIAMDEFSTGYFSLATLQSFPFDKIKIDRSSVINIHKNAQRAAIVRHAVAGQTHRHPRARRRRRGRARA